MQLRDYQIQRERVPLPGKDEQYFEVRGITADDLTFLIQQHHGPITRALKLYQEQRPAIVGGKSMTGFVMALAKDFPDLVSEVISAATDSLDDETRKVAKQLPITTQIIALNEILKLSMEEVDGLKNLLAEMRDRLQSQASDGAR